MLIRKIMMKRRLNKYMLRSIILKAWNLKKEVIIANGEDNCFLFSFEDNGECARILRDKP